MPPKKTSHEVRMEIARRQEMGGNNDNVVRDSIVSYQDYQDKYLFPNKFAKADAEKHKTKYKIYPPATNKWKRLETSHYIAFVNMITSWVKEKELSKSRVTKSTHVTIWKNYKIIKELVTYTHYVYGQNMIIFQIGNARTSPNKLNILTYTRSIDQSQWNYFQSMDPKKSIKMIKESLLRPTGTTIDEMKRLYIQKQREIMDDNPIVYDHDIDGNEQKQGNILELLEQGVLIPEHDDQLEDSDVERNIEEQDLQEIVRQNEYDQNLEDSDFSTHYETQPFGDLSNKLETRIDRNKTTMIELHEATNRTFKTASLRTQNNVIDLTEIPDDVTITITKGKQKDEDQDEDQDELTETPAEELDIESKPIQKELQNFGKASKRKRDYNTPVVVYDQDDRVYMKTLAGPNVRSGEEQHYKEYVYYGHVSESGTIMYNIMEIPPGENFYNQRDSDKIVVTGIHFRNMFQQTAGDKVMGRLIIFYSDHKHYDPMGIIDHWTKLEPKDILEQSITQYNLDVAEEDVPDWDYDPTCLSHYNFRYTMLNESLIILYDYYQEFNVQAIGEEFLNLNMTKTKYVKLDDLQLPFRWDNSVHNKVPIHGCLGVLFMGDFFGGMIECNLNMRIYYETQH